MQFLFGALRVNSLLDAFSFFHFKSPSLKNNEIIIFLFILQGSILDKHMVLCNSNKKELIVTKKLHFSQNNHSYTSRNII